MALDLKQLVSLLNDLKNDRKTVTDIAEAIGKMADASSDASSALGSLGTAFDTFSRLSIRNTDTINGALSSFKSLSYAASNVTSALKDVSVLGSSFGLDEAFKNAIAPISATASLMGNVVEGAMKAAAAFDSMDAGTRELNDNQFKLAANLGFGFSQALKFSEAYKEIVKSNSDLSSTGFFIKADDFKAITESLQRQGFSMMDLAEKTDIAGRSLTYLQTMAMQARAMGMDVESYSKKMSDMVRRSGLSMEDSMKLMASSQDIARDTGLRVDEVTSSLESATNGFQRMGTTIGFGMPVLKGFASSIADVGLGIAQAGDLAADFSRNLLGIVNNPALAYITSMKGGFSGAMGGGGGVLNPSIQMQAMMLDQGPGSQEALAKNLSIGMRETLKSFSGGDIISVKQAAESPELQTRFYTQQQMLGSMFGISDTATQNRVLEYLQKLQEATEAGDEEAAATLEKQISEAANANDKTLGLQEKMSLSLDKAVILAQEQLSVAKADLAAKLMEVGPGGKTGEDAFIAKFSKATDVVQRMFSSGQDVSSMNEEQLKKYAEGLGADQDLVKAIIASNKASIPQPPESAASGAQMGTAATGAAPTSAGGITTYILRDETSNGVRLIPGSTGASPPAPKVSRAPAGP